VTSVALIFLATLGIPWLVCWGLYYMSFPWEGHGRIRAGFYQFGQANWLTYSHFWWAAIWLAVVAIFVGYLAYNGQHNSHENYDRHGPEVNNETSDTGHGTRVLWLGVCGSLLIMVVMLFLAIPQFWNSGKETARHYTTETTFELPSLDPTAMPFSVDRLVQGANFGSTSIDTVHDVSVDIVQGKLSGEGWLPRRNSLPAAYLFMQRNAGGRANTTLREETVAFIHQPKLAMEDAEEAPGYFSAIRDGNGKQIHPEGVVTWDGRSARPQICRFEGDYKLNRALNGERGNNLLNLVQEGHPSWIVKWDNIYGYCDEGTPYIVIPLLQLVRSGNVAVEVPAGVVRISGSRDGTPQMEYSATVEPGEIPGPIYPVSLAEQQRQEANWAAGRKYNINGWGYDEPDVAENAENSGEFLLLDVETSRPVYVTPLRPNRGDSQNVLAYAQVAGDSMTAGQLNPLTITVLDDRGQPSELSPSLQTLASQGRNVINGIEPGFFTAGGRLQEFTPGLFGQWVAFAVLDDGTPKYSVEYRLGEDRSISVREWDTGDIVVERRQEAEGGESTSGIDLSGVSDEELLAEINRRFQNGSISEE